MTDPARTVRKQYHTRQVGDDRLTWDVHRLMRLAQGRPTETLPLSAIAELDELWWYQTPDDRPTPRSVAHHATLMAEADLSYPIIICAEGRVMDGMHRILKALTSGAETVRAVRLDPTPTPDFINVDPQTLTYPDETV